MLGTNTLGTFPEALLSVCLYAQSSTHALLHAASGHATAAAGRQATTPGLQHMFQSIASGLDPAKVPHLAVICLAQDLCRMHEASDCRSLPYKKLGRMHCA